MKPKINHLIWLALSLAILPAISLADNLPNQILWNKDGAEMAYIPAGAFEMGDHFEEGGTNELPVHTVTLDGFYMDKTEVTVGQFKAFLADSDHDWDTWASVATKYGEDDEDSLADDYPMIYVSWHDAVAYADWAGKRLPTEAEWEKAARGGLAGKRYPWGDEIDDTKANYGQNVGKPTVAGSYPANGYGLFDMAGNLWEWCLDKYDSSYYDNSPAENPLSTDYADIQALLDDYDSVSSNRSGAFHRGYKMK